MAVKSTEESTNNYNYLSNTPYSGRNKDEKLDVSDYYKTTTKPEWVASWQSKPLGKMQNKEKIKIKLQFDVTFRLKTLTGRWNIWE